MNAESAQSTAEAITAIQKQGQETLDVLKEYTIHNNVKHDKTNVRIVELYERQSAIEEAVKANTSITDFWRTVKKYATYVLIGALTVYGGYLVNHYIIKAPPTDLIKLLENRHP
ncbi:MAG: hypothetical protein JKY22_12295 [Flavobacteriaceae bacterium]|nr:hypothetical protein [Flavobacteriaceae bacterium]